MNKYQVRSRSCRACGTILTPTSICNLCMESVSWICRKCLNMDDVTHKHNNCEEAYIVQLAPITIYERN